MPRDSKRAPDTSLHDLARQNRAGELRAMLDKARLSIDAYEKHKPLENIVYRHGLKGTPLHVAVIHNAAEAVAVLLDFGGDRTKPILQFERGVEPVAGTTPLDLARRLGHDESARMLNSQQCRRRNDDRRVGAARTEKRTKAV